MSTEPAPIADSNRIVTMINQFDQATLALNSANAQPELLTELITNGLGGKKPEWFGNLRFSVFEDLVWSISDRVDAARVALDGDAKALSP